MNESIHTVSEEPKWYVIHTYSGYEKNVETNIRKIVENRKMEHLIQDLKIPLEKLDEEEEKEREESAAAGKKVKKEKYDRKLLPSYVLVKMIMCDESWHIVRNTRGVTAFVGPGSKPIALTEDEVRKLEIEIFVPAIEFEAGDSVRITDGALKGSIGLVEEISSDRKRLKLAISMFGRQTVIEIETSAVVKIE
jgi:transcriptional antiterminator NusG